MSRSIRRFSPLGGGRNPCVLTGDEHPDRNTAMMGEETFHPDTRALLTYGRALSGAPAAHAKKGRADQVLNRLFVLERTKDGRWPLRSFGAELIPLFGRDLKDQDFASLWLPQDVKMLAALMEAASAASEPAIARIIGDVAGGKVLGAEILLTPLRFDEHLG
ncbi:MAG: PAS domain-containing protein, partial [Caulobacterales bacterium]